MTTFDGSTFCGMDDDAAGDGAASTTQPLDAYLENAVANNATYLWTSGWACSWSPREVVSSDAKIFASWRWATIWQMDLPVNRAISGVSIDWLGAVENRTGGGVGTAAVDVRLRVVSGQEDIRTNSVLSYTTLEDTGGDFEPQGVGTTLSREDLDVPVGYVRLELQIKQNQDGTGRGDFDELPDNARNASSGVTQKADADVFEATQNIALSFDSVVRLTQTDALAGFATEDALDGGVLDVLDADNIADQFSVHWPSDVDRPSEPIDGADYKVLDSLQIKGLQVDVTYRDESDGQYDEKLQSSMLPKDAVRGGDVGRHPQRANAEYVRQRPCVIGQLGETFGVGRATLWRHIYASEASSYTTTQSVPFEFGVSQGRFIARLRWYAVTQWLRSFIQVPSDLLKTYLAASWDFRVTAEQLQDGDTSWADAATIAGPETISASVGASGDDPVYHYPVSTRGTAPWLNQGWTEDLWTGTGSFNGVYREGHLYETDRQLATQNVYSTVLDIDDAEADPLNPARLTVEVRGPQSNSDYDFQNLESIYAHKSGDTVPSQSTLLSLIGLSLYEQGF